MLFVGLIFFSTGYPLSAQNHLISLKSKWDSVFSASGDSNSIDVSTQFAHHLGSQIQFHKKAVLKPGKDFRLSLLSPADSSFLLYTWNLPLRNGKHHYNGLIACKRKDKYEIFYLTDRLRDQENALKPMVPAHNWYGALYYQLETFRQHGKKFYLLLGWEGGDERVRHRVIEILSFDETGSPVFGSPVFADHKNARTLFTFQKGAFFSLKYEKQAYRKKVWYSKRRVTRTARMTVFNRLETGKAGLPCPVGNIVDAYILQKGRFRLLKDIDARNPEEENKNPGISPPARGLFPSQ